MASYPESVKERIFRFPVVGILEHYGKRTDHINEMYYSPFREEASPSFHINIKAGGFYWYDFGSGADRGGLAVDLVALLENCTRGKAVDIVASIAGNGAYRYSSLQAPAQRASCSRQTPAVIIDSEGDRFRMRRLIEYAEKQRGIPCRLMQRYCKEVQLHFMGRENRRYIVIAFQNNAGGYSYRNTFIKGCSVSAHTTIDCSGRFNDVPTSDAVYVFEGFFDFLSWMAMNDKSRPGTDVCVLNSVNNLNRSLPYLQRHKKINVFFDNDEAGRMALKQLEERLGKDAVQDMSSLYAPHKDLNESLVSRRRKFLNPKV